MQYSNHANINNNDDHNAKLIANSNYQGLGNNNLNAKCDTGDLSHSNLTDLTNLRHMRRDRKAVYLNDRHLKCFDSLLSINSSNVVMMRNSKFIQLRYTYERHRNDNNTTMDGHYAMVVDRDNVHYGAGTRGYNGDNRRNRGLLLRGFRPPR